MVLVYYLLHNYQLWISPHIIVGVGGCAYLSFIDHRRATANMSQVTVESLSLWVLMLSPRRKGRENPFYFSTSWILPINIIGQRNAYTHVYLVCWPWLAWLCLWSTGCELLGSGFDTICRGMEFLPEEHIIIISFFNRVTWLSHLNHWYPVQYFYKYAPFAYLCELHN